MSTIKMLLVNDNVPHFYPHDKETYMDMLSMYDYRGQKSEQIICFLRLMKFTCL